MKYTRTKKKNNLEGDLCSSSKTVPPIFQCVKQREKEMRGIDGRFPLWTEASLKERMKKGKKEVDKKDMFQQRD